MEGAMRNRIFGLALAVPLMTVLSYGSTTLADEDVQQTDGQQTSCMNSSDAVTTLPAPLDRWAQLRCTSAGYVITGREGWVWLEPTHKALVVIPSQTFGRPQGPDANAYFTKIQVTKVTGE